MSVSDKNVYVPHEKDVFEERPVVRYTGDGGVEVFDDDGNKQIFPLNQCHPVPKYPDEGYADMTQMDSLHVASILFNLKRRFEHDKIYTYIDDILLSVNPFKDLQIYSPAIQKKYFGQPRNAADPHLYSFTDSIYRKMLNHNIDQSIIVSGESGAGKTEAKKIILHYLAVASNPSHIVAPEHSDIHARVLSSNPILEAFGNAKTVRNNNSSRFGKLLETQFDSNGELSGAKFEVYLLEKSRVSTQNEGEQNFHCFYYLLNGCSDEQRERWNLPRSGSELKYMNQSGVYADEELSKKGFDILISAFELSGFSRLEVDDILQAIATILNIGNLTFAPSDNEENSTVSSPDVLKRVSSMMNTTAVELQKALTQQKNIIRNESVVIFNSAKQAEHTRDTLSQRIYERLFAFIVDKLTKVLSFPKKKKRAIYILDMFGFESFPHNTFEQLCINYANERLQMLFNQAVFQQELLSYAEEGISTSDITFDDNQPCIELFEQFGSILRQKPLGILLLINEETKFPNGNDSSLISKISSHHKSNKYFEEDRFGGMRFGIRHYSGKVCYDSESFIAKNRQRFPPDLVSLIDKSQHNFFKTLFKEELESMEGDEKQKPSSSRGPRGKLLSKGNNTLILQFRNSLISLSDKLASRNPSFVRCIKSNLFSMPMEFTTRLVSRQLSDLGVLEAIRIRSEGFPQRQSFSVLVHRFRCLLSNSDEEETDVILESDEGLVRRLLQQVSNSEQYRIGKTKAFMKTSLYDRLEQMKSLHIEKFATLIQSQWRRFRAQRHYRIMLESVEILASFIRQYADFQRRNSAAISLQSVIRALYWRRNCNQWREHTRASVVLQRFYRRRISLRRKEMTAATTTTTPQSEAKTERSVQLPDRREEINQLLKSIDNPEVEAVLLSLRTGVDMVKASEKIQELIRNAPDLARILGRLDIVELLLIALIERPFDNDELTKMALISALEALSKDRKIAVALGNCAVLTDLISHLDLTTTSSLLLLSRISKFANVTLFTEANGIKALQSVIFRSCSDLSHRSDNTFEHALIAMECLRDIAATRQGTNAIVRDRQTMKSITVCLYCMPERHSITAAAAACLARLSVHDSSTYRQGRSHNRSDQTDPIVRTIVKMGGVEAVVQAWKFSPDNDDLFSSAATLLSHPAVLGDTETLAVIEDLAIAPMSMAVSVLMKGGKGVCEAANLANAVMHMYPASVTSFVNADGVDALIECSLEVQDAESAERLCRVIRNLSSARVFGNRVDRIVELVKVFIDKFGAREQLLVYGLETLKTMYEQAEGRLKDVFLHAIVKAATLLPHSMPVNRAAFAVFNLVCDEDYLLEALMSVRSSPARERVQTGFISIGVLCTAVLSARFAPVLVDRGIVSVFSRCCHLPDEIEYSFRALSRLILRERNARIQFAQLDMVDLIATSVSHCGPDDVGAASAIVDTVKSIVYMEVGTSDVNARVIPMAFDVLSHDAVVAHQLAVHSFARFIMALVSKVSLSPVEAYLRKNDVPTTLCDALVSHRSHPNSVHILIDAIRAVSQVVSIFDAAFLATSLQAITQALNASLALNRWLTISKLLELMRNICTRTLTSEMVSISYLRALPHLSAALIDVVERDANELIEGNGRDAFQHAAHILNSLSNETVFEDNVQRLRRLVHKVAITANSTGTLVSLEESEETDHIKALYQDTSLSNIAYWSLSEVYATKLMELQVNSVLVDSLLALSASSESMYREKLCSRVLRALERISRHSSLREDLIRAGVGPSLRIVIAVRLSHYEETVQRAARCLGNISSKGPRRHSLKLNNDQSRFWRLKNFLFQGATKEPSIDCTVLEDPNNAMPMSPVHRR